MGLTDRMRASAQSWSLPGTILLTVLFGMQLQRAQLSFYQNLFGDHLGWPPMRIGLLAVAVYALILLLPLFFRRSVPRTAALRFAAITGLTAVLAQVWAGNALIDFGLTTLGTLAFWFFWPAILAAQMGTDVHRPQAGQGTATWLLAGLTLSTSVHGLFTTLDPIWQRTPSAFGINLLLLIALFYFLTRFEPDVASSASYRASTWRQELAWLGVGPFWVFILLIGGNVARFGAESGWPFPAALGWQVVGLMAATLLARRISPGRVTALIAGFLLAATVVPVVDSGWVLLVSRPIGLIAAGLLLSTAFSQLSVNRKEEVTRPTTFLYTLASILFVLLIFAYYITFELVVPFSRISVLYVVALLTGLPIVLSCDRWLFARREQSIQLPSTGAFGSALLLAAVLLAGTWLSFRLPAASPGAASRLRVFNYNLHNGFNPQGQLDLEALARTIEAHSPDIVTLQEVSRGWVIHGSVDMQAWLSRRLGMPGAFSPAADADWGHGVLSRFPVTRHEVYALPPAGLPLPRSFAYHELDWGRDGPLLLINTHLHHRFEDGDIRAQQVADILQFLEGNQLQRLLITGDMNAEPDEASMQQLLATGLQELIAESGVMPGYTYSSTDPVRRIDYILATPDFALQELEIPPSEASDHLGVFVELLLR